MTNPSGRDLTSQPSEAHSEDSPSEVSNSGISNSGISNNGISNRWLIIGAMGAAAAVSHALARSTFPILLPAIEAELLSDRTQSGLLGSANFIAYLVGVVLVTIISGKVEPIRLLIGGISAAIFGFVALGVANGLATLAVGQALTGFGSAGIWMSAPAIATGAAPAGRRGLVMGAMSSSMGLGILVTGQGTNLLRAVVDDDQLWRPIWFGAAGFAIALIAATLLFIRVPHTAPVQGGVSIDQLRTVPRWATLSFAYFSSGLVVSSFAAFFGLALKDEGFTPSHITNLFSLLGLAAVLGAVNLGRISDRVGRKPILTLSSVGIMAAALLTLLGREPYAAMAIGLFGAASFTFPVLVAAYLSDHLSGRAFSNALGALTIIYGIGLIIGPAAAGAVADSDLGIQAVFWGLAAISALTAITCSMMPGQTR